MTKEWTFLLYDEFFDQGDIEKKKGLSVTFLCDRDTVNIPASQPGFVNFVVMPLFKALVEIMPNL